MSNVSRDTEIVNRLLRGSTLQEIGDIYDLSRERIRQIAEKWGIDWLRERQYSRMRAERIDRWKEWVKLFDGTMTITQIAAAKGLSPATIGSRFKRLKEAKAKVKVRKRPMPRAHALMRLCDGKSTYHEIAAKWGAGYMVTVARIHKLRAKGLIRFLRRGRHIYPISDPKYDYSARD